MVSTFESLILSTFESLIVWGSEVYVAVFVRVVSPRRRSGGGCDGTHAATICSCGGFHISGCVQHTSGCVVCQTRFLVSTAHTRLCPTRFLVYHTHIRVCPTRFLVCRISGGGCNGTHAAKIYSCSGFHTSGCVQHTSGCVQHTSGCVQYTSGCVQYTSGCVQHAFLCVQHTSGCVQHAY